MRFSFSRVLRLRTLSHVEPGLLTIALPIFAAAIELAQQWVPGRHVRMSDFFVDAAASCLGVGLSYAFFKLKAAAIRR